MRLDIRSSVLVLVLVPTTLIALVLLIYLTHTRVQDLERGLNERGQAIAHQLARTAGYGLLPRDQGALSILAGSVLGESDVMEVALLDSQGQIVVAATGTPTVPQGQWLVDVIPLPVHPPLILEVPVSDSGRDAIQLGAVRLVLSRHATELRQKEVIATALLLTLCCLLVAIWLGQRIGGQVSGPILRLETAVRALEEGHLQTRVEERSSGELGSLERGINAMAAALQSSHEHLQEQVEEAIAEQQETLEELEIKNAELDIARKRAVQASRVKSEFLANMSHEIRTPMNGVMGFVELLARTPLDRTQQGYLQTLRASAQHLMVVLNDILDFTKIEAGKFRLRRRPFNLREALEDTVALYGANARQKGLRLVLDLDPELPETLVGDAARLAQVLGNLTSNAIKFTERGRVEVAIQLLERREGNITLGLEVRDTGVGIAPADQGRLFEAFEQLDASSTRRHGGTGLGLAITRRLVDLMQGQVKLDSRPGQGTRIRISLTLECHSAPPLRPDPVGQVLVISPDPLLTRTLGHSLALAGYQALKAGNLCEMARLLNRRDENLPLVGLILDREPPSPTLESLARQLESLGLAGLEALILPGCEDQTRDTDRLKGLFAAVHPVGMPLTTRQLQALLQPPGPDPIPAPQPPPPPAALPCREPLRVLLADDNEINRHLAQIMISQVGARVDEACNGREAVAACRTGHYDLILMDIHMPELDGVEATRAIRTLPDYGGRPIIALTADVAYRDRHRYLEAGMNDCLAKPVTQEMLQDILTRWCQSLPSSSTEDRLHDRPTRTTAS